MNMSDPRKPDALEIFTEQRSVGIGVIVVSLYREFQHPQLCAMVTYLIF